jgi:hypothetical protein
MQTHGILAVSWDFESSTDRRHVETREGEQDKILLSRNRHCYQKHNHLLR